MNHNEKREIVLKIVWLNLNTFYTWGGDDPSGFDCSGLAISCLKSVGILPRKGDWTAHDLWLKFPIKPANPMPGDLVFYHARNNPNKIIHVEIVINDELSIGASGGGSFVKSRQDAIDHNAFVKVRPFARYNLKGFVNPYI